VDATKKRSVLKKRIKLSGGFILLSGNFPDRMYEPVRVFTSAAKAYFCNGNTAGMNACSTP
jgi:hypothetical protein